jgi:UPF0176 protein
MDGSKQIEIISFYEFKNLQAVAPLVEMRSDLKAALREFDVRGTIIIADEGYNGMVCGTANDVERFVTRVEQILDTKLRLKRSLNEKAPFRKIDVKIKPEIVTLKKAVDVSLGRGTHVDPREWDRLITDPDIVVLDARNDYEYQTGTFRGAVNPRTAKFSDLPAFVAENLDPDKHKRVAMFCTGGIRCEKFAPYLKQIGFEEVYQLEGGILNYLEKTGDENRLWEGECFVFDERITVDRELQKGTGPDLSQRHANAVKPPYKVSE